MKTMRAFIPILLFFFLLLQVFQAFGQSPETLVRDGDRRFNQENYRAAFDLYRQAYDQLEQIRPVAPLLTDIVNNMAAVRMAQSNLPEFQRYFSAARTLKQLFSQRPVQVGSQNLIINGGFEDGLVFPWGTGHYERPDGKFRFGVWWNSNNAQAFMKIDSEVQHSGRRSLRLTNYSPSAPHVFSTLSQRISPLEPNTTYKITCFVKARDLKGGAVGITVDAAWTKRARPFPGGTYDWQAYSDTINIGHNNYIDFRLLHMDTGTLWLDDIMVEKVDSPSEAAPFKQAERLFDRADYGKALDILLKLEDAHRGNPGMLRSIELLSGRTYLILGQYRNALERFRRVIQNGYPRATIDLSDLYFSLGDYEAAETHYKKSLEIVAGDQGTRSLVMGRLSRCYLAQGRLDEALRTQEQSLFILRHIEDKDGQAQALNQKGGIYQAKKQYAAADSSFKSALELSRNLGNRKLSSDIVYNLAENERLQNHGKASKSFAAEALKIKTVIGDQLGTVKIHHLLARLSLADGDLEAGKNHYRQAIRCLEAMVTDAADISRETKATFIKGFSELYREYTDLLMQLHNATGDPVYQQEAFTISEQARSRIFSEMITEATALQSFAATSHDPQFVDLLQSERRLNARINGLEKQIQNSRDTGEIRDLNRRLDESRKSRKVVRDRLVSEYPGYAELKNPKPIRIADVQKLLKDHEIVLSYFITPGRTGLWTITSTDASFAVIPMDRDALIGQCEAFRHTFSEIPKLLSDYTPDQGKKPVERAFSGYRPAAAYGLYRVLVAPAAALLATKTSVFLSLDDLLYKLPFEALMTRPFSERPGPTPFLGMEFRNAPFWVKTHAIAYLPSLTVLRSLRAQEKEPVGQQSPLLAFADPTFKISSDSFASTEGIHATRSSVLSRMQTRSVLTQRTLPRLPDTREEALTVARILGASPEKDIYLRDRASEYNLKHLTLSRYRYLLFATHGLMAGEFGPGIQPALALSFVNDPENDGLLEMGEILGLNLNADMVVLSACNTASGGGENDRGEGFSGLTRSFMYAGSKSLLVTQWSVESGTAKRLVQQTFAQAKMKPIGDALAASKRAMINIGAPLRLSAEIGVSTAHPFFWAPYILVGED